MYKYLLVLLPWMLAGQAGAQPKEDAVAKESPAGPCDLKGISLNVSRESAFQNLNIKDLPPVSESDSGIIEYMAKSEDGIITLKVFARDSAVLFGVINVPASAKSGMKPYIFSRAYTARALANLDPAGKWAEKAELLGQTLQEVTSQDGGMKSLVSGENSIVFLNDESIDQLTINVLPNQLLEKCNMEEVLKGMDVK